jgi:predicted regulator of Ras-like GTPase activity (Roadblock/LC7/MglB family)
MSSTITEFHVPQGKGHRTALIALLLVCVFWGSTFPLMQLAMAAIKDHLPRNSSGTALYPDADDIARDEESWVQDAEAERRAGRARQARRLAEAGLVEAPYVLSGRVVLALACLDLGDAEAAREALEPVVSRWSPGARESLAIEPAEDAPFAVQSDPLADLAENELENAFEHAESEPVEVWTTNRVAEAALMGSDGLPISQVDAPGPADWADDVGVLGVEFGRILDEARKAAAAASAGPTLELAVRTERFHVLVQMVDRDTYLVLVLGADGNVGKGRYLMRRHLLAIRQEL